MEFKSFYYAKKEKKDMNKKLLELLDKINAKKVEVKNLAEAGNLDAATKAKEELKNMQQQFDILKDLDDTGVQNITEPGAGKPLVDKDPIKEFANAARTGFQNQMKEGTPADGGYTVPEDIQTKIEERRAAKASLIDLVDVENVTTNKGARTYKKRSSQTGFSKVGEGAKIQGGTTPQFERMEYEISKYAGYFPATNELLEDSDANVAATLINWIGDESRVTRNKIILAAVGTKEKTELKDLDDIKKALNVTLGQAFKPTSKIITNDDGLQYLDTLKDADGKYLLQPNQASPMEMVLCAGATRVPVVVIPNADLASDTTESQKRKIPVIIGDLKEGIKFFDRKKTTITISNVAVAGNLNAFEEDLTLYRAIEREDCKVKDKEAFVNGQIIIKDTSAA